MATARKREKELTQREVASMGGKAAAAALTKKQRSERGKKAATARWKQDRARKGKQA